MDGLAPVRVLRIGHRPGRDERTTTHVGLTARALGADGVVLAGSAADRAETIASVTDRFGGPFAVETTDDPLAYIADADEAVVHLTMYGLPIQDRLPQLRDRHRSDGDSSDGGQSLLVVVGASKVPFEVYERADWNLAVTNQPHSEIAALAVFLDRLYRGEELDREWVDADRAVVPRATGKRVEDR
ncbi:tRNA (cytidine(56)-2'-O)-methyltransferase [Halobacteriales archaeon QH_10_67_13]|nr:MAG: tRNA (cytidine(56)-2'-O)-methyltransferase [Halobacteriales archaeon QH_10_67_13]